MLHMLLHDLTSSSTTPPMSLFSKIIPPLETSFRHGNPTPTYLDHNGRYPRLHAHPCSFLQPKEASKRISCSRSKRSASWLSRTSRPFQDEQLESRVRTLLDPSAIEKIEKERHEANETTTAIPSQHKPRHHSSRTRQTSNKAISLPSSDLSDLATTRT